MKSTLLFILSLVAVFSLSGLAFAHNEAGFESGMAHTVNHLVLGLVLFSILAIGFTGWRFNQSKRVKVNKDEL